MKLMNTITERKWRQQLLESRLIFKDKNHPLVQTLVLHHHATEQAILLNWIPDQTCDDYLTLIDGHYLVSVEIEHNRPIDTCVIETISLHEYKQSLSRQSAIQLEVALDIVAS